jgi:subtilisin family serine protease
MGMKGEGIRVVMIDSGFDHSHPFFSDHQYKSEVVLAGDAKDKETDPFGHGTGESANVFSVAPHVEFIGVKIGKDTVNSVFEKVPPASLLEGFYVARQQNPDIISISVTHNLQYEMSKKQRAHLPKSVKALEAEILHAIASGITVVVAAGNGEFSFPGMMPDVISAGGVHVDKNGRMRASNYASAFYSKIYSYRHVPDICGLVGMCEPQGKDLKLKQGPGLNLDNYILLPVPAGSLIDAKTIASLTVGKSNKYRDKTGSSDGWALFSGTSAAAPQIAGVCALLKAKKPSLTPWEIKAILQATAIEVLDGHSNPDSSDDGTPQVGAGATGGGLVDAFSAWRSVT